MELYGMAQGESQSNCAPPASDLPTYSDAVKDRKENPAWPTFTNQSLYHLLGYILVFIFGLSAGVALGSHMVLAKSLHHHSTSCITAPTMATVAAVTSTADITTAAAQIANPCHILNTYYNVSNRRRVNRNGYSKVFSD